jgi:hypothetical protein
VELQRTAELDAERGRDQLPTDSRTREPLLDEPPLELRRVEPDATSVDAAVDDDPAV